MSFKMIAVCKKELHGASEVTFNPSNEPAKPQAHKYTCSYCSYINTEMVQLVMPETAALIPQVRGAFVAKAFWKAWDPATPVLLGARLG